MYVFFTDCNLFTPVLTCLSYTAGECSQAVPYYRYVEHGLFLTSLIQVVTKYSSFQFIAVKPFHFL